MFVTQKKYKELLDSKKVMRGLYIDKLNDLKEENSNLREENSNLREDVIVAKEQEIELLYNDIEALETQKEVDDLKLEEYKDRIKELEEDMEKLESDTDKLGYAWNNANRDLWANHEAQRQLRKLGEGLLETDTKVNHKEVAKQILNIAMLMGGGKPIKYVGKEALKEGGLTNEK